MRLVRLLTATAILMALAIPAWAVDCTQTDGQPGVYINGVGSPDDQCLTADEYAVMVSVDSLIAEGLVVEAVDNGDGSTTVEYANGGITTILNDPLERPVAANTDPASPAYEPDAPTVREVLFSRTAYAI